NRPSSIEDRMEELPRPAPALFPICVHLRKSAGALRFSLSRCPAVPIFSAPPRLCGELFAFQFRRFWQSMAILAIALQDTLHPGELQFPFRILLSFRKLEVTEAS